MCTGICGVEIKCLLSDCSIGENSSCIGLGVLREPLQCQWELLYKVSTVIAGLSF